MTRRGKRGSQDMSRVAMGSVSAPPGALFSNPKKCRDARGGGEATSFWRRAACPAPKGRLEGPRLEGRPWRRSCPGTSGPMSRRR